ncbi:unnamed protein product [Didymodactylos carnosus]|uniref:Uncharacterized protein n=1 Tax=Didymodactylos carnosus TaxID=1234261 RepID=A0A8S2GF65_9BILA|nr:unnamed protein product [Didymodactylos carnosus]CAF3492102.1 unnamed protein product [Didymodactylos carnosus]
MDNGGGNPNGAMVVSLKGADDAGSNNNNEIIKAAFDALKNVDHSSGLNADVKQFEGLANDLDFASRTKLNELAQKANTALYANPTETRYTLMPKMPKVYGGLNGQYLFVEQTLKTLQAAPNSPYIGNVLSGRNSTTNRIALNPLYTNEMSNNYLQLITALTTDVTGVYGFLEDSSQELNRYSDTLTIANNPYLNQVMMKLKAKESYKEFVRALVETDYFKNQAVDQQQIKLTDKFGQKTVLEHIQAQLALTDFVGGSDSSVSTTNFASYGLTSANPTQSFDELLKIAFERMQAKNNAYSASLNSATDNTANRYVAVLN